MKTRLFSILLLSLTLLWPALRNGEPFLMSDTTTYIRGADAAVYKLTGVPTMWTATFIDRYGPTSPAQHTIVKAADPATLPVTIAGRSIFYGALLYLFGMAGSFWGAAIFQAAVTGTAVTLASESLCRALGRMAPDWRGVAMLAIMLGISPAGYFAGYMMPDIFLPLGILAFCQIAFLWPFMSRGERTFWIVLLTAAMLFHNLHLAIIAGLFILLLIVKRRERKPAGMIMLAMGLCFAAQAGVSLMITRATGAAPVAVPFVTARLIADGPGRDYLMTHCPRAPFILCDYRDRLRQDSDSLLWSYDARHGLFSAVPPRERRRISAEQTAFVIAVAQDRPWILMQSTGSSILRQAGKWRLPEFNYGPFLRDNFANKLPLPALEDARRSAAYRQAMPVRLVEILTPLSVVAGLLLLAFGRISAAPSRGRIILYLTTIAAAITLNIILCGAVSTPHDRYLMRLIWLLPLCAAMCWRARLSPKADPI